MLAANAALLQRMGLAVTWALSLQHSLMSFVSFWHERHWSPLQSWHFCWMHFSESSFHWQVRASGPDNVAQGWACAAWATAACHWPTCNTSKAAVLKRAPKRAMATGLTEGMSSELDPSKTVKTHFSHILTFSIFSWMRKRLLWQILDISWHVHVLAHFPETQPVKQLAWFSSEYV